MASPSRRAVRKRRTNQALLILLPLAILTGVVANMIGRPLWPAPAAVHGAVALAIVVVTPWKAPIVRKGLGRRRAGSVWSVALLAVIVTTLASGLIHSTGAVRAIGPLTVMQVHIASALVGLALLAAHYRRHPVPVRRTDLGRRSFLGSAGLAAAGVAAWTSWEALLGALGSRGAERRFTGSHERGSGVPSAMPVTSWLDDEVQHIDATAWAVRIDGRSVGLAELRSLAVDFDAVLDCTGGWYSRQRWTGVPLSHLVRSDRRSVSVASVTGYARRFPSRDLDRIFLVTEVGGEPLSAGHGFPARIVAPGRRGFWWVKWVSEIEASDVPWWLQLPFPLT